MLFVGDGGDDGWELPLAHMRPQDGPSGGPGWWEAILTEEGTDLFMGRYLPGDSVGRVLRARSSMRPREHAPAARS